MEKKGEWKEWNGGGGEIREEGSKVRLTLLRKRKEGGTGWKETLRGCEESEGSEEKRKSEVWERKRAVKGGKR